jgi:hypothetical protein
MNQDANRATGGINQPTHGRTDIVACPMQEREILSPAMAHPLFIKGDITLTLSVREIKKAIKESNKKSA